MAKDSTTAVTCKRCERPIPLARTDKVTVEFSVSCPKCGHRGIYRVRDIKAHDDKRS